MELAWKVEGTDAYHQLTRRSRATMRATTPLTEAEPGRKRLDLPEMLPLATLKARLV
jgi:phenylacetic acid degradation protein